MGPVIVRASAIAVLLASCILLEDCKTEPPARRYPMHGQVVALDAQSRTATIKHGKIGDWMEAMTMEYPIKTDSDFKKLAVGKQIDATVFVTDGGYSVGDIRVASSSSPPSH